MKKVLTICLIFSAVVGTATPLIWRGASCLKPGQFIGHLFFTYSQTTKTYDWTNKEWKDLAADKRVTTFSTQVMVGFSPIKNLELKLMAPLTAKSMDTFHSFGLGDLWLKTRYGLISQKLSPVKFTLSGALVLPTSPKDAKPALDDRVTKIGLGGILQTKDLGPFIGHLRFGYWLNGKKNDTTKMGDMFEYFAKVDYKVMPMITAFLTLLGTMEGKTKINNVAIDKTEKDRHNLQFGLIFKPIPILWIRPKAAFPLLFLCKGGAIAPFTLGLDFWVIAP
ncbi:MAG: hypothetical protein ABIK99_06425 [candidate division WOR-3 bacterium]